MSFTHLSNSCFDSKTDCVVAMTTSKWDILEQPESKEMEEGDDEDLDGRWVLLYDQSSSVVGVLLPIL